MFSSPAKCRILYIEDNPTDVQLLGMVLSQEPGNFELIVLEDGDEGIAFIESPPFLPDVIALDLGLPKLDGFTVLTRLKDDPVMKSIPVLVFVSPNTRHSKRAEALRADFCLAKPCDLAGYQQIAQVILNLWHGRTESTRS
jgi:two-component system response regulator